MGKFIVWSETYGNVRPVEAADPRLAALRWAVLEDEYLAGEEWYGQSVIVLSVSDGASKRYYVEEYSDPDDESSDRDFDATLVKDAPKANIEIHLYEGCKPTMFVMPEKRGPRPNAMNIAPECHAVLVDAAVLEAVWGALGDQVDE